MKKIDTISLRCTPEMKSILKKDAELFHMNVTEYIEHLITLMHKNLPDKGETS